MGQAQLPPGFRFHPTEEELICYYLKRKVMGKPFQFIAISEVELYKFAPWDLPEKSCVRTKDLEWYFFCPRDKKYPKGSRANRSTEIGYWKTTGKDRSISHNSRVVGMKKSLIFHTGKPPKGDRTDWVMYEYRLADEQLVASGVAQDAFVICKIFKKSGMGPKIGEQYGAPFNEEDWEDDDANLEATVAAFPFLPFHQPAVQSSNDNNATTSTVEPVPAPVAATTITEPVPVSDPATPLLEPVPLSLDAESVAGGYNELPVITCPPFGTPQYCDSIPITPETDGIQLDELEDLLLNDAPHHPGNGSGQLAPLQQPSPAMVNFNEAGGDEINQIYGELVNLIDGDVNDNVVQPLSELGAQHYVELNDIIFDQEEDFFLNCYDPALSPEMEVDICFRGYSPSEHQNGSLTSDWGPH
jgi:hypothetical protein